MHHCVCLALLIILLLFSAAAAVDNYALGAVSLGVHQCVKFSLRLSKMFLLLSALAACDYQARDADGAPKGFPADSAR